MAYTNICLRKSLLPINAKMYFMPDALYSILHNRKQQFASHVMTTNVSSYNMEFNKRKIRQRKTRVTVSFCDPINQ